MIRIQKTTLCLAVLFACTGTMCISVYLFIRRPEDYLLLGAAVSAVFSAVSLLVGIICVCFVNTRRKRQMSTHIIRSHTEWGVDAALSENFRQRRKVLDERLNIDEPHFCTHAQAPCTSWSFCGSERGKAAARGSQRLPIILRSGHSGACLALPSDHQSLKSPLRTTERNITSA